MLTLFCFVSQVTRPLHVFLQRFNKHFSPPRVLNISRISFSMMVLLEMGTFLTKSVAPEREVSSQCSQEVPTGPNLSQLNSVHTRPRQPPAGGR